METFRASHPNADLWRRIWHYLEELGGLQQDLSIRWTPGHDSGMSINAIGNRWADTVAKMGASVHEIPEDASNTAVALRKELVLLLKWYGRSAALYLRPGMPPSRTPKQDRLARNADERRALAREREAMCN